MHVFAKEKVIDANIKGLNTLTVLSQVNLLMMQPLSHVHCVYKLHESDCFVALLTPVGIGLAHICNSLGYKCVIFMPDTQSKVRYSEG